MKIKATTDAARLLVYYTGEKFQNGNSVSAEFLVPLAKAWVSDIGFENTSLCVQVHGGVGYMQDSAASQLFRDARVLSIYEGTNGIQAIDFSFPPSNKG